MIAAALAVIVSGAAIFVAPGAVVLAAAAVRLRRAEWLAFAFAVSLALLTAAFAACLAFGLSIDAASPAIAAATLVVAVAARRYRAGCDPESPARVPSPVASRVVLGLMTAAAVAAAVAFAPVGSVDRWWYLAYVRGWLEAPVLSLAEPFLGTGHAFARFGVHPWLFGLATWSRMTGIDPVLIYERAAPVVVVLASVSAARCLATELFGQGPRARLTVMATILLWSGGTVPLLARAGEDKVLAATALLPLCLAAFLRVTRMSPAAAARRAGLVLLLGACIATAAVHALAYAFALVALLPLAAMLAVREPLRRSSIMAATVVLAFVAIAPAVSGFVVRGRLHDIGADTASIDHPVVRVHEGRGRLVDLPFGGYVVSPRLLVHPLSLLALFAVPLVLRRRDAAAPGPAGHPRNEEPDEMSDAPPDARSASISDSTRALLLATLFVPLAIAFVPPLPVLAGSVIPPWMVYRVLWLLPVAPLAAIAAARCSARIGRSETAAVLLLLLLGVPVVLLGVRQRLAETRGRMAAPASAEFVELVHAIRGLPRDALLVAAPELSERLPAFTARHMLAALDRSTVVFAGSRQAGEARLRARAALLAGDSDGSVLAKAAGVAPTHAVFDPRMLPRPRCGRIVHQGAGYALCELAPGDTTGVAASDDVAGTTGVAAGNVAGMRDVASNDVVEIPDDSGTSTVAVGECGAARPAARRNPWSAAAAAARCHVPVPPEVRSRENLLLRIDASAGRAADELRIFVEDGTARPPATVRISGIGSVLLRMPGLQADIVQVRIESSFLPFVKPLRVALEERGR